MMIRQMIMMPPPPTPCMLLPAISVTEAWETQHIIVPIVNRARERSKKMERPNMALRFARNGIVEALVRR